MIELSDTQPNLEVLDAEYARLLGYPRRHVLEGRSRELADSARQWFAAHGRAWVYARQTGLDLGQGRLRVDGTELSATPLLDQCLAAGADSAVLVAVSAGRECEEQARRLWQEGKPDEYFFMEIFGSAVVEHLVTVTGGRICDWAEQHGMRVLPHYSPGYSGWDISEQARLWQLIRHNGASLPGELHVLETGMLNPKKSLLALFGVTRHLDRVRDWRGLVPCQNCSLPGCRYRRAPCQYSPPQLEEVRRLQSNDDAGAKSNASSVSGLGRQARYSLNLRALQKWSQERLQLKTLHDGSIEARFRYEGTTCSNLGQPLEFDYHLELATPEAGYRIIAATCVPAPGDTGHASQCEYLSNAESLMRSIAAEKPLLGRPLNDVLTWQRPYSPSGCYCDADRRAHKWGLVLEVIHYALVQRECEQAQSPAATLSE